MSDRVGRLYIEFSADGRPYIKGLKDLDQETDKTGRRLTSTWKSVGAAAAGAAVGGLAGLALAVQKVGLYAIKTAASFEYEMSRVKANANGTAAEMNKLRDVVLQLGKDTAFSAGETAQAANELIKAGFTIEQTMASLAGTLDLAAAGELSVAQAAEITANTLSQFSLKAKDAGMVADVLANAANLSTTEVTGLGQSLVNVADIAASMGWTLQETNAALALLANNGVKGAVAGTALKSMLRKLTTPTDQARKAMERYGISLYDANGNAVEAAELIRRLQDAFVGLSDADRELAAGVIFGSYGIRAANILIKEGAAAFDEMTAAVGRTGAAQDIAATKLDNLYGSWEQLKGAVETLTINLGTTLLPKVREFVDELTGIVDYAIETGDWSGVGERVAVLLGEGIKTAAPYVASAVWELVKAAASGTGEAVAAFMFGMDLDTGFNKQRDYIAKRMADAYRDLPRTDAFQRAMEDLQSNWFTGAFTKQKDFNVPKAQTREEVLALAAAFGLTLTDAGVAIVAENNAGLYKRLVEGEGVTGGSIWSPGQEGLYGARIKELAAAEVELEEKVRLAKAAQAEQLELLEKLDEMASQLSATYTTMTDPAAIWDEAKGSLDSYLAKMDEAIAAWGDFEGNLKLLATKFGPEFGADVIMKAAELGPEFVAALVGAKPEVVRKALGGLESHLGQNMDALSRHLNALCAPVGASAADTMWSTFAEGYQKSQAAKLAYTWGLQLKQGLVSGWNAGPAPVVQIRTPQGGSVAVPAFRAWGGWVGSYDSGGWVGRDKGLPAPEKSTGRAVPIIAHEGELVLTENQADWLAGPVGSY
ncbi:MAG: phage tail tape measure protein, partial [Actinobacteria bacterium]|nr:phage tail tape measure protein [Actinomycetota bacterium]